MPKKDIFINENKLFTNENPVSGDTLRIDNQDYYKISNYNSIPPFFMNIVNGSDLWMFISSNGALSAGRRNSDNSLFPYYTDDKIHDSKENTGAKTIIIALKESKNFIWEPFSSSYYGINNIERNLYKSIFGNKIIFEEINHDLKLSFKYSWSNCDKYGFVRKSTLINLSDEAIDIKFVDGIQNILPADLNRRLQLEYSNLVDAYKKSELHEKSNLAAYVLSSIPTDKAEPSESLRANISWSVGLDHPKILLSNSQLDNFRLGAPIDQEVDIRAKRGAYFVNSESKLNGNDKKEWYIIADVNKEQSDFFLLAEEILNSDNITSSIEAQIASDNDLLKEKISGNDGIQLVNDKLNIFRHTSNVLFNIMRGGVFENNYLINKNDFINFIKKANTSVFKEYKSDLEALPNNFSIDTLFENIQNSNQNLQRLSNEYLPLTFSRRHGDPSRPWNHFSIDLKDEFGKPKLDYQGNWRDIFQNWEALALSYPEYIESMIAKFVNASTADGYNPYRVTRDGFDWEVIEPDDEWSYIGYWGDHQIIYLLKLLELSHKYHPERLDSLLAKEIYTYANVPYKIKPYQDIVSDPHNTIDFNFELNDLLEKRVKEFGQDGKFCYYSNGNIVYTNLLEKLLLPLLVKLSNFIPGAGIWMNTQRPEWNDANNALVGYGSSMVTLYYIRRYILFLSKLLDSVTSQKYKINQEVLNLFINIYDTFKNKKSELENQIDPKKLKQFLDQIGQYGSHYRDNIYSAAFKEEKSEIEITKVISFLNIAIEYVDHSIKLNKRDDGLYHAYNLIKFENDKLHIRNLYEMLEGQVAVLSSGYLSVDESIELLQSLRKSSLYREDQNSYILYPNRTLPRFDEKNFIPSDSSENLAVIEKFSGQNKGSIFKKDISGNWHFSSKYRNARILKEDLLTLKKKREISDDQISKILYIYEEVFDHQSFSGRSGTFFKYEGLGSIYWHMVSKLLLAVQETYFRAIEEKEDANSISELRKIYYEVKDGLGIHKNPKEYGAFPTDPYSHTPENEGVQQPGMTGQVKEDIISRFGELGVIVSNGKVKFMPNLLNLDEFLTDVDKFNYFDVENKDKTIKLDKGMLAFTLCQIPVVYKKSDKNKVIIIMNDGKEEIEGLEINPVLSKSIFQRENRILEIHVNLK